MLHVNIRFGRLAAVFLLPAAFHLSRAAQPEDAKGDTLENRIVIKTGFADVSGARLYYEEAGSGPALALLHAGIADSPKRPEVPRHPL